MDLTKQKTPILHALYWGPHPFEHLPGQERKKKYNAVHQLKKNLIASGPSGWELTPAGILFFGPLQCQAVIWISGMGNKDLGILAGEHTITTKHYRVGTGQVTAETELAYFKVYPASYSLNPDLTATITPRDSGFISLPRDSVAWEPPKVLPILERLHAEAYTEILEDLGPKVLPWQTSPSEKRSRIIAAIADLERNPCRATMKDHLLPIKIQGWGDLPEDYLEKALKGRAHYECSQ